MKAASCGLLTVVLFCSSWITIIRADRAPEMAPAGWVLEVHGAAEWRASASSAWVPLTRADHHRELHPNEWLRCTRGYLRFELYRRKRALRPADGDYPIPEVENPRAEPVGPRGGAIAEAPSGPSVVTMAAGSGQFVTAASELVFVGQNDEIYYPTTSMGATAGTSMGTGMGNGGGMPAAMMGPITPFGRTAEPWWIPEFDVPVVAAVVVSFDLLSQTVTVRSAYGYSSVLGTASAVVIGQEGTVSLLSVPVGCRVLVPVSLLGDGPVPHRLHAFESR